MAEHEQPIASFTTLTVVWLLLLLLTGTTVYVSRLPLGPLHIWAALGIAALKSALVIWIFMQLRHERWIFKLFLLIALSILAIFIGLNFFDVLYR